MKILIETACFRDHRQTRNMTAQQFETAIASLLSEICRVTDFAISMRQLTCQRTLHTTEKCLGVLL